MTRPRGRNFCRPRSAGDRIPVMRSPFPGMDSSLDHPDLWPGRTEYPARRTEVSQGLTSLVEIDLLRDGRRLPVRGPVSSTDYVACWFRGWERPSGWVVGWSFRDPLPRIPLQRKDGDIAQDLSRAFATAYERGHCERLVDYSAPPARRAPAACLIRRSPGRPGQGDGRVRGPSHRERPPTGRRRR